MKVRKMPQIYQITETSALLHDANCIYCHADLELGDQVVVCNKCDSPHHSDCWRTNQNHCATFGCVGRGRVSLSEWAQAEDTVQPNAHSNTTDDAYLGETEEWQFIALEYCWLILNRVYMVFVTKDHIAGARVGGPIAALPSMSNDANAYVRRRLLSKYQNIPVTSDRFLKLSRANFRISRNLLSSIEYFPTKWGMGTVPYTGRLVLNLSDGKKKELIILGTQDASEIKTRLLSQ